MIPPTPPTPIATPTRFAVAEYLLNKLPPLPPLDKEDYENVRFWDKGTWEQWARDEKEMGITLKSGVQGQGTNSSWMEDTDGNRVEIHRQRQIIAGARLAWTNLSTCGISLLSYRESDEMTLSYFRRKVETDFQELRLCSNHWKADKLWMENFSTQRLGKEMPQFTKVSRFERIYSSTKLTLAQFKPPRTKRNL